MAGITHLTLTITLELTRYESGVEIRIWNWEKVQSVNTSPYKSVIKKSGKYIHRNKNNSSSFYWEFSTCQTLC